MDFVNNINGMNRQQEFQQRKSKPSKPIQKNEIEQEKSLDDECVYVSNKDLRKELNEMQSHFAQAQGKINILQLAGESLEKVSQNLSQTRSTLLNSIEELKEYELNTEIQIQIENINKLEMVERSINSSFDKDDYNYSAIIKEVENISYVRNKVKEIKNLEKDLNDNNTVTTLLDEINSGINYVSSTNESLSQIREQLITSVKTLSITLENMISAQTKIRSFELASKMVDITKSQILHQASRSIETISISKDVDSVDLFNQGR